MANFTREMIQEIMPPKIRLQWSGPVARIIYGERKRQVRVLGYISVFSEHLIIDLESCASEFLEFQLSDPDMVEAIRTIIQNALDQVHSWKIGVDSRTNHRNCEDDLGI